MRICSIRSFITFLSSVALAVLAGCGGGGGASAPAPTGVTTAAGDSRVTVSWTAEPGVEYWLFYAAVPGVTPENWTTLAGGRAVVNVTSPYVAIGLSNGTAYSFAINGRKDGGPGGPGSVAQTASPRLAGVTWASGAALGTTAFNGVSAVSGTDATIKVVAVGNGGSIYSSADGKAWISRVSGVTENLNGVITNGAIAVAVGNGGTILQSTNGEAWTKAASGTTANLNAVTTSAIGSFVAVGAGGTIVTSIDGLTWVARASNVTSDLLGVNFVNSNFVALGAAGTVLVSADLTTWANRSIASAGALRAAAFGATQYVLVGEKGAVYTSADAITWASQVSVTTQNLTGILAGSQLIAIGDGGTILNSINGTAWSPVSSGTTQNLSAIATRDAGYIVVGANGANLTSY